VAQADFNSDDWTDRARREALVEQLRDQIRQAVLQACLACEQPHQGDEQFGILLAALACGKQDFENRRALFGYIRKSVIQNLRREEIRQTRQVPLEPLLLVLAASSPPDEECQQRELLELAECALADLDEGCKRAVLLHCEGRTFKEIGVELGVSKTTACRLYREAIGQIQAKLGVPRPDGPG
jgi:RNA polymerase sigma factor (sigma-70 family)